MNKILALAQQHERALALVAVIVLVLLGNGQLAITDPVESNYALTAKEMLASGDFTSPRIYGNYWYDKPIFFYWELIAAFQLFGIEDFPDDADFVLFFQFPEAQFELFTLVRGCFRHEKTSQQHTCLDE